MLSVTQEVVKLRLNPEQFDPKTCRSNLKCNPASDTQHPKTFYLNAVISLFLLQMRKLKF